MQFFLFLLLLVSSHLSQTENSISLLESESNETTEINGSCGSNVFYTINKDGNVTIYGQGPMTDYKSFKLSPFTENSQYVERVFILEGVTTIGEYAFYNCTKLLTYLIPNTVTIIKSNSFCNCTSLGSFNNHDQVTTIESRAYFNCTSLFTLVLSRGITKIGYESFANCITLYDVLIMKNVVEIGHKSFENCHSISKLSYLGVSDPMIGIFNGCEKLEAVRVLPYYEGKTFGGIPVHRDGTTGESMIINGSCGENAFYTLNLITKNLTIQGTGPMQNYTSREQSPFTLNGAFIKYIFIDDLITSIGNYAFKECKSLITVNLSKSATVIGEGSFYQCSSLSSITFPENVDIIDNSAFFYCEKLTSIVMLGNVTSIINPFSLCNSFSYIFYKGYKEPTIESNFDRNLVSVDVMYYYEGDTFNNIQVRKIESTESMEISGICGENLNYTLDPVSGVLEIYGSGEMFNYSSENPSPFKVNPKYVFVNSGVTSIGEYTFYECKGLHSINISESVTSIGCYAFYQCTSLSSIVIPNVSLIREYTFFGCESLLSVSLLTNVTMLEYNSFYRCSSLSSITYKGIIIPEIQSDPFNYCDKLVSAIVLYCYNDIKFINLQIIKRIPPENPIIKGECGSNVTYVYNYTSCALTISGSGNIDPYGFDELPFPGIRYLAKSLIIEENITSIGSNVFYNCVSLESVIIDGNVKTISINSFYGCTSLSYFLYKGLANPSHVSNTFSKCLQLKSVDVMYYYNGDIFCNFPINRIQPEEAEIRGKCGPDLTYIFSHESSILTISGTGEMSNSSYSDSIFKYLQRTLKYIKIEEGVTTIGECSFYRFYNLVSVDLPKTVTTIGRGAFCDCLNLTSINTDSVESIGMQTFSKCTSLASINISNANSFGTYAFEKCYEIKSLDIPSGIKLIPQGFLYDCNNIISVYIPDSVESIGSSSFAQCSSLLAINIPVKVTNIPYEAFKLCSSLKSVVVNGNLSSISTRAFQNCSSLSNFSYKGLKQPEYASNAFSGCLELTSIDVLHNYAYETFCNISVNRLPEEPEISEESSSILDEESIASSTHDEESIILSTHDDEPIASSTHDEESIISSTHDDEPIESSTQIENGTEEYSSNQPFQAECNSNAPVGCLFCYESNNQQCLICDVSLNFYKNPNDKGLCTCTSDYILSVNGECIKYIQEDPPVSFTKYNSTEELPGNCVSIDDSSLRVDTSGLITSDEYDHNKLYETTINSSVKEIKVEKNAFENVQITINNRKDDVLNVSIESDQQIQIEASNSSFPINFQSDSQNISIKVETADSQLTIGSIDNSEDVNLGNISVSNNSFTFIPKVNLIIDSINLFSNSKISTGVDAADSRVTAKRVNIQRGSQSKISNISISEELNIASNSVISIDENVKFDSAKFAIYKMNQQPMDYTYFNFTKKVTQYPKLIQIFEMNESEFLNENEDKVIIIHQSNTVFDEDMCMKWSEQVDTTNGYKGNCVTNDRYNDGHNSVYATKSTSQQVKSKGKSLSGGEIAGIVVGCVAAIAIIALVVYFIIKKRKQLNLTNSLDENNDSESVGF